MIPRTSRGFHALLAVGGCVAVLRWCVPEAHAADAEALTWDQLERLLQVGIVGLTMAGSAIAAVGAVLAKVVRRLNDLEVAAPRRRVPDGDDEPSIGAAVWATKVEVRDLVQRLEGQYQSQATELRAQHSRVNRTMELAQGERIRIAEVVDRLRAEVATIERAARDRDQELGRTLGQIEGLLQRASGVVP